MSVPYIERCKTEELLAQLDMLQDKLATLEKDAQQVREDMVEVSNELIKRSVNVTMETLAELA